MSTDQEWLDAVVSGASDACRGDEVLLASVAGEDTDFVRFNHGDVRQAGSIHQVTASIELVDGRRHASASVELAGDVDQDLPRVCAVVERLREQVAVVPEDPFLLYHTEPTSTAHEMRSAIPDPVDALACVRAASTGTDLVGIYASGDTWSGFGNSLGQRNWFRTATFAFDWSVVLRADKAAKNLYAGFSWDQAAFERKVDETRRQLAVLDRSPITLPPGDHRAYLAPAAVGELMDLLSWGGFGIRSHRTRQTPLLPMLTEGVTFSPMVTLREDTAGGTSPHFSDGGFLRPDEVVLVDSGELGDTLVSPRSSREYGVATNGASSWESPESLAMSPGDLDPADAVERLGTGLHIGNLWYTNYSDRAACRATGMTRFATFWADGGELVAPVDVLRFDDTLFHLFGDRLEALTTDAELAMDPSSYERRSTGSSRLPGALVSSMRFVL